MLFERLWRENTASHNVFGVKMLVAKLGFFLAFLLIISFWRSSVPTFGINRFPFRLTKILLKSNSTIFYAFFVRKFLRWSRGHRNLVMKNSFLSVLPETHYFGGHKSDEKYHLTYVIFVKLKTSGTTRRVIDLSQSVFRDENIVWAGN